MGVRYRSAGKSKWKSRIDRDEFIRALREKKIGTSMHFIPIHLHPFFAPLAGHLENHCPRALELYPRLISLRLYPTMSEERVDYVIASIKEIVRANRKKKMAVVSLAADYMGIT